MAQDDDNTGSSGLANFARARVVALAELGAVGLALLTLLTFFGASSAFADIAANFRHIYALLALLPLGVLGYQRRYWLAGIALVTLVINLALVGDALPYRGTTCEPTLTIATINALGPDNDVDTTVRMLGEHDVDLVVVTELGGALDSVLSRHYPHVFSFPSEGTAGMGIFSRLPLSATEKRPGAWFPQVFAVVDPNGRPFSLLGIHPPPPFQAGSSALRNREVAEVADVVRSTDGPFVVAGDFNLSRQSYHFSPLLDAGLVDSRIGRGIHGTWPAPLPLRVAIDHVLATPDFEVCSFSTASAAGSDHLPVIVGYRW